MTDLLIMIFGTLGSVVILIAAVGIVRMPDFYLRLSVTVKAATLGSGFILIGAAIFFPQASVTTKALAIIFFLVLTGPVAAHMIGRVAYFIGAPKWDKTLMDDMEGMYDREHSRLKSGMEKTLPDAEANLLD